MYYRESSKLNYRECGGFRNGPDLMMFSSHEIGYLKGFFSKYEQYNDSSVSVSISAGYYDLTLTVTSDLDKGDSWCNHKLLKAIDYVKKIVIERCKATDDQLDITIELYTA